MSVGRILIHGVISAQSDGRKEVIWRETSFLMSTYPSTLRGWPDSRINSKCADRTHAFDADFSQ
jgi:hypothetical protein